MDVKEAAKKAAAYTADIETVMNPKSLSEFLSKSGFAIESTRFDDARNQLLLFDGCNYRSLLFSNPLFRGLFHF